MTKMSWPWRRNRRLLRQVGEPSTTTGNSPAVLRPQTTSMGLSRGLVHAQMLAPDACQITLVTFVPFLTGGWIEEPTPKDGAGPHSSIGRNLRIAGDPPVDPAFLPLLEDLRLWAYSDTLNAQLRVRLPHRVTRTSRACHDLSPLPELRAGEWQDAVSLLDIWNFGVGLATFVNRIAVTDIATWEELRRGITGVVTKQAFLARAEQLIAAAVRASNAGPVVIGGQDAGPPLWTQEIIVVEAGRHVDVDSLDDVARRLTADGQRLRAETEAGGASLRLGIEACVVSNPDAVELRDALARVVATQTAVWAAAIDFDRLLGTLLRQEDARRLSLQHLEDRSMDLLAVFERVQRFRAEIEIIPLHLAARDKEVWTCVNAEWSLSDQLSSLDTKLNAVEHVYEHAANAMHARRGRFLNNVVLAITMLSLATFWLTVWEFTQKRFDPFDWISAVVALVAVVLSGILFSAVWRLMR